MRIFAKQTIVIVELIKKKIKALRESFVHYIKQGVTPNKLSLTIVLGVSLSVIPVLGINTVLCFVLALVFRLNIVIIQAINYILFPLQIFLILPFIKLGQNLYGFFDGVSAPQMFNAIKDGKFKDSFQYIVEVHAVALVGWLSFVLPVSLITYYFLVKYFKKKEQLRKYSNIEACRTISIV